MSNLFNMIKSTLLTKSFAVTVISILLGASAAGWILTEMIPINFPYYIDMYRDRWGDGIVRIIEFFRLYDPFHSFWFCGVLALFFVVLLLCVLSRSGRFVARAFRFNPPSGLVDLEGKRPRLEIPWRELRAGDGASKDLLALLEKRYASTETIDATLVRDIYGRLSSLFRTRGYSLAADETDEGILFTALAGRWRYLGNLLFHIGILVITAGGVVGSFWGWREVLSGRKGDLIPLYGSSSSILVRDFEIVTSRTMEIKDYISSVSVLGEDGDTLKTADIEVNHPLKFGRYEIYQNGYHIDEKIFDWAIIGYTVRGSATSNLVTIKPGEEVGLEGTELTLRVMSFFPDFRRSAKGPYTASGNMANPALEIEIASEDGVERGWLFYFYPRYNSRFSFPVNINLVELEPLFYTELQISTDPGAPVFLVGIMIGTLGTLMLYMFNYRSIKGFVGRERLVVVGVEYRWKLSFGNEFMELGRLLRAELSVVLHSGTRG